MARLIYSAISSLDGYIEDMNGKFDWAAPDEQVHTFINNLERSVGTHLYGRRMYETLIVWETDPNLAAESPITRDFAEIRFSCVIKQGREEPPDHACSGQVGAAAISDASFVVE